MTLFNVRSHGTVVRAGKRAAAGCCTKIWQLAVFEPSEWCKVLSQRSETVGVFKVKN